MNKTLKAYLEKIGGKPVDKETLKNYKEGMERDVIPTIERDIKERQRLVAAARYRRATGFDDREDSDA